MSICVDPIFWRLWVKFYKHRANNQIIVAFCYIFAKVDVLILASNGDNNKKQPYGTKLRLNVLILETVIEEI